MANTSVKLPAWISAENFAPLAAKEVENFKNIVNFDASPALAPGENYASVMIRVSFDAQRKSGGLWNMFKGIFGSSKSGGSKHLSYMLKLPHDTEQARQMLEMMNMFHNESDTLRDVLPEFEQMYKNVGVDVQFGPTALRLPKAKDESYVLMEDLGPDGYKNVKRTAGLDVDHSHLVLKKLAQYHAASACRFATKGPFSEVLMNGMKDDVFKDMWVGMMGGFKVALLDNLKSLKDGEKYLKPIEKYFDTLREQMTTLFSYDPKEFNVLSHGDCWSNNILFKYSAAGQVEDVRFVDFQLPRWSSPLQDIIYFLLSSTKVDIKVKNFEYFLRFYYDHLIANLKLLKYTKVLPTLRELHLQSYKYGGWAGIAAFLTMPIVLQESTVNAQLDSILLDNAEAKDFKNQMYANKTYQTHLNEVLPWMYKRGFLGSDADLIEVEKYVKVAPKKSTTPAWLTPEQFEDILRQNVPNFKAIKSFTVVPATEAGDNFASTLLKINVDAELSDGTVQAFSYILKIELVASAQAQSMLATIDLFGKENSLYTTFLPQFEQLYKAAGVDVVFGPKSYQFSKSPGCDYLLMENLQVTGFSNVDRLVGLDLAHTKCVLKKLSEFHAASACYHAANGAYPELLRKGIYDIIDREVMRPMQEQFTQLFVHCMKGYEGSEVYREKIEKNWLTRMDDVMTAACYNDESRFNVLNHGDSWTNNIMFQYDAAGQISNMYFVDYQMCRWGSPAQDLYYFMTSSPMLNVKMQNFDELMAYYYDNLKKNLELLKYPKKIPTMEDLQEDLKQYGFWAYLTINGTMCVVLLDPSKDANIESMLNDDEASKDFKLRMYTNPRYKQHSEQLLAWLNSRGIFDVNIDKMLVKQ